MQSFSILVICTGNSCRSQIAEGYLKYYAKKMNINVNIFSAGINAEGVNPKAIQSMAEDNIDISNHSSNTIEEYLSKDITHIITVCDHANENCPVFLKKTHSTHQNFIDPSKMNGDEKTVNQAYTKCREEIKVFTGKYLEENFLKK